MKRHYVDDYVFITDTQLAKITLNKLKSGLNGTSQDGLTYWSIINDIEVCYEREETGTVKKRKVLNLEVTWEYRKILDDVFQPVCHESEADYVKICDGAGNFLGRICLSGAAKGRW